MNTIISTKPYPCSYAKFDVNIKSHTKRKVWEVRINGGSGVMQGKGHIYTPDGVATSIDALAVGISLSVVQANIFFAAVIIGLITALLCSVATVVGRRFGTMLNDKAEVLGGVILIGIGFRILISHLIA